MSGRQFTLFRLEKRPGARRVGTVRKFGLPPVLFREETVTYPQDRRHVYRIFSPASPAKDYHGDGQLTEHRARSVAG